MSIVFGCDKHEGSIIGINIPKKLIENSPDRFIEFLSVLKESKLNCENEIDCCTKKYNRIYEDSGYEVLYYKSYSENKEIDKFCRYIRNYITSSDKKKIRDERKSDAKGNTLKSEFIQIAKWQEYKCYFCFTPLDVEDPLKNGNSISGVAHWDHLKPLSRGGNEYPLNMALVCIECNLKKGNKNESEFWKYMERYCNKSMLYEHIEFHSSYRKEKSYLSRRRQKIT